MSPIEVMARAMAGTAYDADNAAWWRAKAIAGLKAIRDPSSNMCEAGSLGPAERADPIPAITTSQAESCFTAMIDAAISGP